MSAVGLRAVSTASMNDAEAMALLNKQRMVRPSSPWHIYVRRLAPPSRIGSRVALQKPQLTSVTSLANRATGTGLSLAFYAFALSYAAAPALGIPFSGQSVVNLVANLPGWFVVLAKTALSGSFWFVSATTRSTADLRRFHTWNGCARSRSEPR